MNSPQDPLGFHDADYETFGRKVQGRTGIRLGDYKEAQMRRRIGAMAQRAGCLSFLAFYDAMERTPALLAEFLDKMTINVSELLRNPNHFLTLTEHILPSLVTAAGAQPFSIWSAGCSYGAEAYTLALLLHEMTPIPSFRILGTDIDDPVLQKARRGTFSALDMNNLSPERRAAHFTETETSHWSVNAPLRASVQFTRHDLLSSPYPTNEYDLIVCRNVVIYFTDAAKARVYQGFYNALRPGGALFVGGTERLSNHRTLGFELLQPFFYRKPF